MAHGKLGFVMPATCEQAFEAFFNHAVRLEWDTLLRVNYVEGGGTHPYVGAVSTNVGRGWKSWLSMRTRFLSYNPPYQASAEMVAPTGPFALWAASMRFRDRPDGKSDLVYLYSIRLRPQFAGMILDPVGGRLFARETRLRFAAMARYLERGRGTARAPGVTPVAGGGANAIDDQMPGELARGPGDKV